MALLLTKLGTYTAALVALTGAAVTAAISPVVVAAIISAVGTILAATLSCLNVWISTRILTKAQENHDAVTRVSDTARDSMNQLMALAEGATDATDATDTGEGA